MAARVLQLNVSEGGVPKRPIEEATVTRDGLVGDRQRDRRYHGGLWQAVCWFASEGLDALARDGYRVVPGSLGENVTTSGLEYRDVRIGDTFRLGEQVRLQITKPRAPCTTIQVYGESIIKRLWGPDVPWGESGFYARVVELGTLRPGDEIRLESAGPEAPPPTTRKLSLAKPA